MGWLYSSTFNGVFHFHSVSECFCVILIYSLTWSKVLGSFIWTLQVFVYHNFWRIHSNNFTYLKLLLFTSRIVLHTQGACQSTSRCMSSVFCYFLVRSFFFCLNLSQRFILLERQRKQRERKGGTERGRLMLIMHLWLHFQMRALAKAEQVQTNVRDSLCVFLSEGRCPSTCVSIQGVHSKKLRQN